MRIGRGGRDYRGGELLNSIRKEVIQMKERLLKWINKELEAFLKERDESKVLFIWVSELPDECCGYQDGCLVYFSKGEIFSQGEGEHRKDRPKEEGLHNFEDWVSENLEGASLNVESGICTWEDIKGTWHIEILTKRDFNREYLRRI